MRFRRVTLRAPLVRLAELADFYGRRLGLPTTSSDDELSIHLGETLLQFTAASGDPFYHFALLVPGDRFDSARAWAQASSDLLPDRESGRLVFDFTAWNARACYFHDPAGNIVELIAHEGVAETEADGAFRATEVVAVSELGLVGDQRAMAEQLIQRLRLVVWDGTLADPQGLAFVGERARTLILAPAGRSWLPTGRAAEPHAVELVLAAPKAGEVELEGSRYRISASAA
jgi:catechol-2,3-dioxygenase